MSKIKVGQLAPSFNLKNQDGEDVSLKELKGKNVVLYFYPRAMTPGCTVQACGIRDSQKEFADLDTVVLGVSPDPVDRLERFREKKNLNFDLLADEEHKIADKYGVWGPKKFMGKKFIGLLRTTFIIDKKGHVAHIIDKVKTKSHHEDVIDFIRDHL